jgi:hypothetical protein
MGMLIWQHNLQVDTSKLSDDAFAIFCINIWAEKNWWVT